MYLSGMDKDHPRPWEFMCTKGLRSGQWTTIAVPSCWELQGFGNYNYGHDDPHADEQGLYRYRFEVHGALRGQRMYLVFEGCMTDTEVRLNGMLAGEPHQGAFYPFRYDVTDLIKVGESNLLEVTVNKESANESINRAERQSDYWIFGGIFRPVYLLFTPQRHIERVEIDARANGNFRMNVATEGTNISADKLLVRADIVDLEDGQVVATLEGDSIVEGHVDHVKPWSTEKPHRYEVVAHLMKGKKTLHTYHQKFGFRTIEFRQRDGFYLNGSRLMFKGVCRHTFWPESGRASSKRLAIEDVNLMKDMNMNAVRMSHYPPDDFFLDVCDSMGLMVIDELAGWQKKYDTDVARRLVKTMIQRDVNHPSILIWSNGNEGGFNTDIRPDYALHDIQGRKVIEPFSEYDGTDTKHYPVYDTVKERLEKGANVFFPTEFLHGLYDGGHGAGLEDYWQLMTEHPTAAGGFLWNLADEGVVRHDRNDSIDCDALHAPDGILGPHHEKEGSFYTIRDIWSPIQVKFGNDMLTVRNDFLFTNLEECRFEYDLVCFRDPLSSEGETIIGTHTIKSPELAPQQSIRYPIPKQSDFSSSPFDVIRFRGYDPHGRLINTWSYTYTSPKEIAERIVPSENGAVSKQEAFPLPIRLTVPGTLHWTQLAEGWIRLDYEYTLDGDFDYAGLTIDCSEEDVEGAILLADGPYHTWKNRLRGNLLGLYDKAYNNTVTGESWDYPEFKGYYSHFHALKLKSKGTPLTIVCATDDLYLHLFTPHAPVYRCPNVEPPFPDGGISILHCIPAIGTKFSTAQEGGPQGAKNHFEGQTFRGTLYLRCQ